MVSTNGHVFIPPSIILKMIILLILYNVRSEGEFVDTIPGFYICFFCALI